MLGLGLIRCLWTAKGAFEYLAPVKLCITVINCLRFVEAFLEGEQIPAQHPLQYLGF